MRLLEKKTLRNVIGWKNAPVPICMGGDYRALTFCCKPGCSLVYGFKCLRDQTLKEVGFTSAEFIELKEKFSKKNNWDSEIVCFGSISYCCMRASGCERRDLALSLKYPNLDWDKIMEIYFKKKNELSEIILKHITNPSVQKKIKKIKEECQIIKL